MGCGSAGQQLANVPPVCLVNAACIRYNVVLDEFNITVHCCSDDVGFACNARRRRLLQDMEAVRGGGGRENAAAAGGAHQTHPKVLQHASITKTNAAPFCTKARTCNLPKWPDITRAKQSAFQLDAVR
jgi:hypothetical protein